MPEPLKIFIGSSHEALRYAKDIQQLIYEEAPEGEVTVTGWWKDDVFPVGSTFIESLVAVMKDTDAAILVASEDDRTVVRGSLTTSPRDNVTFECGMAIASHGRHRTAVAVFGKPSLPSDLAGVTHVDLDKEQLEINRGRIRNLIRQWKSTQHSGSNSFEVVLPALYAAILRVLTNLQARARHARVLDVAAAGLLESVAEQFTDSGLQSGITKLVCDMSETHLANADAIWALDVLGPSAWLKPAAFRYLAIQIREYLRANVVGGRWSLQLSPSLVSAIRRASQNVLALTRHESQTRFGDQFFVKPGDEQRLDFAWTEGNPRLEFGRILLWTEEELLSPVTESVSAIHEAFHVPLFAAPVSENAPEREFDFIVFKQRSGDLRGFYNLREGGFVPQHVENDRVPRRGKCVDYWSKVTSRPDLMFAADLYHVLRERHRSTLR